MPTTTQSSHLIDQLVPLRKRKWLIIASVIIIFSLAFINSRFQQPVYQAKATILIDDSKSMLSFPQQRWSYEDYYQRQRALETHFRVIKSYPLVERVVTKLWLRTQASVKVKPVSSFSTRINRLKEIVTLPFRQLLTAKSSPKAASQKSDVAVFDPVVTATQRCIEVIPIPDTNLVTIRVTHINPVIATTIANTLTREYKEYLRQRGLSTLSENLHWLTEEVVTLKKKVAQSEAAVHQYKEKFPLVNENKSVETTEMVQLRSDFNHTRTERLQLEEQVKQLEKLLYQKKKYIPPYAQTDLLQQLSSQMVAARLDREKLLKTYKAKHPRLISINSHINFLGEQFNQEIKKIRDSLNSQYTVLVAKEKSLTQTINSYQQQALQQEKDRIQYSFLEREATANQELYDLLVKQLNTVNISEGIKQEPIKIIEAAKLPLAPIKPHRGIMLIVSILAGLIIGVSLSFFLEYLDRTVKNVADVEEDIGLPVLGIIPSFK